MKRSIVISFLVLAVFVLSSPAHALTLTLTDQYYLGTIDDGIPASEANQEAWITQLAGMSLNSSEASTDPVGETLFRSGNSFATNPLPDATFYDKYEDGELNGSGIIITGAVFDYVLGKYGNGNENSGGGTYVWYIGDYNWDLGTDNQIILPEGFGVNSDGPALSHISVFNAAPVPEPATMLLLGIGLLGVAGVSRKKM